MVQMAVGNVIFTRGMLQWHGMRFRTLCDFFRVRSIGSKNKCFVIVILFNCKLVAYFLPILNGTVPLGRALPNRGFTRSTSESHIYRNTVMARRSPPDTQRGRVSFARAQNDGPVLYFRNITLTVVIGRSAVSISSGEFCPKQ
jgi:hypothetical protein